MQRYRLIILVFLVAILASSLTSLASWLALKYVVMQQVREATKPVPGMFILDPKTANAAAKAVEVCPDNWTLVEVFQHESGRTYVIYAVGLEGD